MSKSAKTWRILAAHSNSGVAVPDEPDSREGLREVPFRRRTGRPLPGDRVALDAAGAVHRILTRRNVFGRGVRGGRFREMAANLDQLLIVVAPRPAPSANLIHRYLAAAAILDIAPLLVLNKIDLPHESLDSELERFTRLGHAALQVCAETGHGLEELRARLGHGISLAAGQSGVGKTSLANRLVPDLQSQTAALSRVTGKGTHTTTTCQLHRLPDGGWLADSPGVWEYSLWNMPPETLRRGFPEFGGLTGQCRFRNCLHVDEPGCRVLEAVNQGQIPGFRHRAWRQLLSETGGRPSRPSR